MFLSFARLILSFWLYIPNQKVDAEKGKNVKLMLVEMTLYRSSSRVGWDRGGKEAVITLS